MVIIIYLDYSTIQQEKILENTQALKDVVTTLVTDGQQYIKDVTDKLVALSANQANPETATAINDAVASLTALDQAFKTADAALNPPTT